MDSRRDTRVGQLAIRRGLLTAAALEGLLTERAREPATELEEFLVRRGALTPDQAREISLELGAAPTIKAPSAPGTSDFTRRIERLQARPNAAFPERYAVSGEIARGGMGAILDARDLELRRELVIKVMLGGGDPGRAAKFVEEAQVQGQLEHPNICPIHEMGVDDQGRLYFTMKKVRGRSLAEILRSERTAAPPEDRYATVGQFQRDIQSFLEGRALAAAEYTFLELAGKWVRRNRVFALTASVALVLLVAAVAVYVVDVTRAQRKAEANQRRAELRTAEALVAQGDALGMAGDWREARARYAETREAAPFAADLGMLHADRELPPALLAMTGHAGPVSAVAFSPDGRRALSGGDDRTLRVWDTLTGRLLRTVPQKTPNPLARMRSLWLKGDTAGARRELAVVKDLPELYRALLESTLAR